MLTNFFMEKISTPVINKILFLIVVLLQIITFWSVDHGILAEYTFGVLTDKIVIIYAFILFTSFNGKKNGSLFISSVVATLLILCPQFMYNSVNAVPEIVKESLITKILLTILYPAVLSVHYYYHNYGIKAVTNAEAAFLSIWQPIIKTCNFCCYFIFNIIILVLFIFAFKLANIKFIPQILSNIYVIKILLATMISAIYFHIYNLHSNVKMITVSLTGIASNLYNIVAILGVIFVLSFTLSSINRLDIPDIELQIIFVICAISIILYHLQANPYTLAITTTSLQKKITRTYNNLLPLLPTAAFIHLLFFYQDISLNLKCNASLIYTGLHWHNYAILLECLFFLLLAFIQAYYSNKSKYDRIYNLSIKYWWILFYYVIICQLVFIPSIQKKFNSNYSAVTCYSFKSNQEMKISTTYRL